ncbi:hypothetical protein FRC04_007369 [Tulasnella sp. 424]|nr:hypothetical protein FRC04_007369 [Tulasnella sp. 424]
MDRVGGRKIAVIVGKISKPDSIAGTPGWLINAVSAYLGSGKFPDAAILGKFDNEMEELATKSTPTSL